MKKFCKSLREDTMKINNFEKKKMKSLTNEQQESNQKTKIYSICKENVENKYLKHKNIVKLEIIVIIQRNIQVLCIAYVV